VPTTSPAEDEPRRRAAAPEAAAPAGPGAERFVGVVIARESVDVSLSAPARLARVHVRLGDRVEAGQVLAEIDTAELDADLAAADAALREAHAAQRQATATLRQARVESRRSGTLARDGLVSQREASAAAFDQERAASELERARALVTQRRAALAKLRQTRERAELQAPLAGRVISRGFDPGALVPATAPIVTIISGERDVRFAVPPEHVSALEVGGQVLVIAGDATWPAEVTALAPEVDTAMQMVVAEARLDADAARQLASVGTRVSVAPGEP
jgi:RND family efflux transporter MFP subunit